MSRSGNHAIANWIFLQAREPRLLLNCAEGKTNPYSSCRPLASGRRWRGSREIDIEAERRGQFSPKSLLMHTYEDSWLGHAFSSQLSENHDDWVGPSRRQVQLIVIRDPCNLMASRIRMGAGLTAQVARKMWKQHAKEALAPSARTSCERMTVIYNRWKRDRKYRRRIASSLEIPFTDEGFEEVPSCAGGSSFDGTKYDGRASQMATEERWKVYRTNEEYQSRIDEEMIAMSESLLNPASHAA